MSQSLSSIPQYQRVDAIRRRIKSGSLGLGFWAAVDAVKYSSQLSADEAQSLLQMAQKTQQAAGIPANWTLYDKT